MAGAALVAAGRASIFALVPATGDRADGRYDWRGTIALAIAAIGLLTALTLVVPLGWASPVTAALRANLATVGRGWALFGTYLLVPEFALTRTGSGHYGLGVTTAAVGLLMVPLAVGQAAAGPLAGLVSRRTGPRPVFATGLILLAAALGWLSVIRTSLPQCEAVAEQHHPPVRRRHRRPGRHHPARLVFRDHCRYPAVLRVHRGLPDRRRHVSRRGPAGHRAAWSTPARPAASPGRVPVTSSLARYLIPCARGASHCRYSRRGRRSGRRLSYGGRVEVRGT